jgi:RNA polymerase sigma factor (sigma-70 family)
MNGMIPVQFQEIFAAHYPSVWRKIMNLVQDRAIAEDLAQEVFLKLYRSPPDDLDSIGAWLHRVLTNAAYDYLRKVSRQQNLKHREELAYQTKPNEVASNEEVAIQNWELNVVKRVLQKLSIRDREALVLKEKGYSYAEIAHRLQVNRKSVGSLIMRANKRFRKNYLQEEAVDE